MNSCSVQLKNNWQHTHGWSDIRSKKVCHTEKPNRKLQPFNWNKVRHSNQISKYFHSKQKVSFERFAKWDNNSGWNLGYMKWLTPGTCNQKSFRGYKYSSMVLHQMVIENIKDDGVNSSEVFVSIVLNLHEQLHKKSILRYEATPKVALLLCYKVALLLCYFVSEIWRNSKSSISYSKLKKKPFCILHFAWNIHKNNCRSPAIFLYPIDL